MHEDSQGIVGAPRLQEDLAEEGEAAGLDRVARRMAGAGLQGWPRRRRREPRGRPGLPPPGVQSRLERDLTAPEPETKWVTDITEIPTDEGKLHLSVVLDLYSKLQIGWSMHHRQDRQMVIRAVE